MAWFWLAVFILAFIMSVLVFINFNYAVGKIRSEMEKLDPGERSDSGQSVSELMDMERSSVDIRFWSVFFVLGSLAGIIGSIAALQRYFPPGHG
ncbi:MAG: hypothetical protein EKK34_25185 [Mycobacterium sp.]|nr:MAG: hypothetical protein EKK34_25185 [Mycobacterium sp.]